MSTRTRRVVLPLSEWRELSARGRRQVRAAAWRGQTHPDPYVARVARAWATEVLRVEARPSCEKRMTEVSLSAALLAVVGVLLGPAAVGASLGGSLSCRERRLARRLLVLSSAPREPADW